MGRTNIQRTSQGRSDNANKIKYLVSVDPAVTFLGTVSDSGNAEHSLVVRAIKLPGVNSDPKINFNTNKIGNLALFDPYALTLQSGSNLRTTRIGDFGSLGSNSGAVAGYSPIGGARNSLYIVRNSQAPTTSSSNGKAGNVLKSLINAGNNGNVMDFFKNLQFGGPRGGTNITQVKSIEVFFGPEIREATPAKTGPLKQELKPQDTNTTNKPVANDNAKNKPAPKDKVKSENENKSESKETETKNKSESKESETSSSCSEGEQNSSDCKAN